MIETALTTQENLELEQCESVIEHGLRTFVDVGNALLAIRDGRLYRERCATFEDYCRVQWGFVASRARQLISAAQTVAGLETVTMVTPSSERQVRPLMGLEPEQQRDAWAQVVEENPDGKITGAKVKEVVDRLMIVPGTEDDPDEEDDERGCYNCQHGTADTRADNYDRFWCALYERLVNPYDSVIWCKMEEWTPEEVEGSGSEQFYQTTNARQDVAVTVFSSESNEYYTPAVYVEAARTVMGGIDLDPASCEIAQRTIQAGEYYTEQDDGLAHDWRGRVWMNPPYGKVGNESSQGHWAQRMIEQYKAGNVTEAVFLVKAAVGYEWFELLWDELPVCFARARVSFVRANGSDDGQSKQGTAFFYVGPKVARFADVFKQFGRIILPERQL